MNRLKELRKEKKQTQKEFAKETGTPLRTLQSWENGESQIKPDKAQQLADYFGVSVAYLLGYSEATNFYEEIHEVVAKEPLIAFIEFLVVQDILLTDEQVQQFLDFLCSMDKVNRNLLSHLQTDKERDNLFAIHFNYTTEYTAVSNKPRIFDVYENDYILGQFELVQKILNGSYRYPADLD